MYFCTNCGKEYENQASFCAACGSPVVAAPTPAPTPSYVMPDATPVPAVEEKEPFLHTLFAFIAKIMQIFAGFSLGMAIAECYLDLDYSSGYYSTWVYGSFEPNDGWAVMAMLAGLAAMGMSVVGFIFSLIKKSDLKTLFSKIACMALSMFLFILGCVFIAKS